MFPAPAPAQSPAQTQTQRFSIPPGGLAQALNLYARQVGVELIYRSDEVGAVRSRGVTGTMSREAALKALLADTDFGARQDASGAIAVIRRDPVGNRPGRSASGRPRPNGPGAGLDEFASALEGAAEIIVTAYGR